MDQMDVLMEELNRRTKEADRIVCSYLPYIEDYPGNLDSALRYSVTAGGKRIRPMLLSYTYQACGGMNKEAEPFMAAMEYIHTASLIHDDLPAIDNDDLRRGKETVHKAFGEADGILAGDALLNYAYEVMIKGILSCSDTKKAAKAAEIIASKSGLFGMLGGQGLDVESEKGKIAFSDIRFLDRIYKMKTSALIEASLMSGAVLGGAPDRDIALLEKIGTDIGMAFQIRDDILDHTGTSESLGKPAHSDEKNNKETTVTLLGLDKAEEKVRELTENALSNTKKLSFDASFLSFFILYLMDRTY